MSALKPELTLGRRGARGLGGDARASAIHQRPWAFDRICTRDGHAGRHPRGGSCARRMHRALESAERRALTGRRSPRSHARSAHRPRVAHRRRRDGRGPVRAARRDRSRLWRSARGDLPTRRASTDAGGDDHAGDRSHGSGQGRHSGQPAQPMIAGHATLRRDGPIAELVAAREVALLAIDAVDRTGIPAEDGHHRSAGRTPGKP